MNKESNEVIN